MGFKSGFVSIVGRTNVGKSTLLNSIIGEKVAITSNRPQTTRNQIRGIYTDSDSQVVFIDTPGMHKPRNMLGEYMIKSASSTLTNVDVVLFVVEATDLDIGVGDNRIINQLKDVDIPVILVINKIDKLLNKEDLLRVASNYKQMGFDNIIFVSAFNGEGVDLLIKEIKKYLLDGPKFFPDDIYTDQAERVIVSEIIRKQALNLLDDEIPHGVAICVNQMKDRDNGDIYIEADIYCEREAHKPIIIGKKGQMLKRIGEMSRKEIEDFVGSKVFLKLWVKVKKNWQDNENILKNFFEDFDLKK